MPYRTPTASVGETIKYSLYEVQYVIKSVVKSLAMIFQGDVGREDVAGPIRMVSIIDETVEVSRSYGLETMFLNLCPTSA